MILRIAPRLLFMGVLLAAAVPPAMADDYACLIEPRQMHKLATPVTGVIASK